MNREKYTTRTFLLRSFANSELASAAVMNAPRDSERPLEVVIREQVKARKPDQNARMWAGPLADMQAQAYVNGRTYSAEVWHEQFKREFLPEEDDPDLAVLAKDGYRKWDVSPSGDRVCIGSTTKLTTKGFAEYMDKIYAYGASLGVQFSASPNEMNSLEMK